jgi:DhnA family fructose-bisphosphate aldolase class Ia
LITTGFFAKTNPVVHTGSVESFMEVTGGCPVPVVIAGGEKMETDEEIFGIVEGALKAGAAGLSIGRNAFQHKNPTKIVQALSMMVHKNADVEEALTYLQS